MGFVVEYGEREEGFGCDVVEIMGGGVEGGLEWWGRVGGEEAEVGQRVAKGPGSLSPAPPR